MEIIAVAPVFQALVAEMRRRGSRPETALTDFLAQFPDDRWGVKSTVGQSRSIEAARIPTGPEGELVSLMVLRGTYRPVDFVTMMDESDLWSETTTDGGSRVFHREDTGRVISLLDSRTLILAGNKQAMDQALAARRGSIPSALDGPLGGAIRQMAQEPVFLAWVLDESTRSRVPDTLAKDSVFGPVWTGRSVTSAIDQLDRVVVTAGGTRTMGLGIFLAFENEEAAGRMAEAHRFHLPRIGKRMVDDKTLPGDTRRQGQFLQEAQILLSSSSVSIRTTLAESTIRDYASTLLNSAAIVNY